MLKKFKYLFTKVGKNYLEGFRLIQFKDEGRIITYLPDFPPTWYEGMNISCIFKIKIKPIPKPKYTPKWIWNKKYNYYLYTHLFSSQVNAG